MLADVEGPVRSRRRSYQTDKADKGGPVSRRRPADGPETLTLLTTLDRWEPEQLFPSDANSGWAHALRRGSKTRSNEIREGCGATAEEPTGEEKENDAMRKLNRPFGEPDSALVQVWSDAAAPGDAIERQFVVEQSLFQENWRQSMTTQEAVSPPGLGAPVILTTARLLKRDKTEHTNIPVANIIFLGDGHIITLQSSGSRAWSLKCPRG
ncbi:hypothetical protein EYF80_052995 [Liparis tanakae]|uniref:Uncharacterized protein n=1 Tax=Liparis tanakae TaxID=230148 RepID=A0A4Z2F7L1_9TELE|nr:hypothetical protein EYF80_052995 [Liparis tanakae]